MRRYLGVFLNSVLFLNITETLLVSDIRGGYMGKGDKKTRRGKIWRHSYGKTRLKANRKRAKSGKK